ncbi:TPA: SagB/ThcOx family dehydrogenase [Streptococcus suis]|nr:SagB/ThcOx family dehydrogenase [Streptococcus suis]
MNKFKESCIDDGEQCLFLKFHRSTSLSLKDSHLFENLIARAFDDIDFMREIKDKLPSNELYREGDIILKPTRIEKNILDCILERKSDRDFNINLGIDFEIFSSILLYSYGPSNFGKYTVPSAGGTFPIHLLVNVKSVKDLESGLYEYNHKNGTVRLLSKNYQKIERFLTSSQSLMQQSAFSIHFIGKLELIAYKYGDRSYRFLTLEAGHIAQNLSLVSTAYSIGSVCSGGFLDGEFIDYLTDYIDEKFSETVYVYEMYFGKLL